jgi:hypothetical protein
MRRIETEQSTQRFAEALAIALAEKSVESVTKQFAPSLCEWSGFARPWRHF